MKNFFLALLLLCGCARFVAAQTQTNAPLPGGILATNPSPCLGGQWWYNFATQQYLGCPGGTVTPIGALAGNNAVVDGSIITSPNQLLMSAAYINGGNILWNPSSPQIIPTNPFGNTSTLSAVPYVGIPSSGCTANTFASGVSVTEMLVLYDAVLGRDFSSQTTFVTPSTGYCPTITALPTTFPGLMFLQMAWCTGASCGSTLSNFQ